MATLKKGRGRATVWPTKIIGAGPAAMELYTVIGKLMRTPGAFADCHIYSGASLGGEPVIKFNGEVTKLPHVVASYLGLPSGRRRCETTGCCNPFHYLPGDMADNVLVSGNEKQEFRPIGEIDPVSDWVDLVEYEMDKRGARVESVTFEQLRGWIAVEDLSDNQIQAAIVKMKEVKA